jgi:crotonobetainyl-CoA:carnitine CoA-transferase CaiB-like acyl-CoA transferase
MALMPTINYHPVQCADGRWLQLGNLLPHLLTRFCDAGLDDGIGAYGDQPATWPADVLETFRDRMLGHMQTRTAAEWIKDLPPTASWRIHIRRCSRRSSIRIVENGHVAATPAGTQLGVVAKLTQTPEQSGRRCRRLKCRRHDVVAAHVEDSGSDWNAPTATEGVTIVEFATIIAAPLAPRSSRTWVRASSKSKHRKAIRSARWAAVSVRRASTAARRASVSTSNRLMANGWRGS